MDIVLEDGVLKQVDHFKYLRVCFRTGNEITLELNHRIGIFNGVLSSLFPLFKD